ncbi:hypothetical protein L195_g005830 [Trifolium pratense]|uniref:Uncharacterized protein n=1 Tax=Trifolium pratense TaxID=57577 RepID=A0A2K3P1W9_TRIPR|nr:hypothetical protein L195_g005830 [Trifolium pratense]
MEPLLGGESSGIRNRSRGGRVHRTDAITYGSNYEKAAALIDLELDPTSESCYKLVIEGLNRIAN